MFSNTLNSLQCSEPPYSYTPVSRSIVDQHQSRRICLCVPASVRLCLYRCRRLYLQLYSILLALCQRPRVLVLRHHRYRWHTLTATCLNWNYSGTRTWRLLRALVLAVILSAVALLWSVLVFDINIARSDIIFLSATCSVIGMDKLLNYTSTLNSLYSLNFIDIL